MSYLCRNSHSSKVWCSLNIGILTVFLLTFAFSSSGCYQPSSIIFAGEQTSRFLDSNTDIYFTFNLKPGLNESTQFAGFVGNFRDVFFQEVERRFGFLLANLLRSMPDVTTLVGPEVAVASLYTGSSAGVVFFIQTPRDARTWLGLLLWGLNIWLAPGAREDLPGGIVKVTRTIDSETTIEYYATSSGYVVGAIGNVALADFQQVVSRIPGGIADSLWNNSSYQEIRSRFVSERMGLGYLNGARLPGNMQAVYNAITPYLPYLRQMGDYVPVFTVFYGVLVLIASPVYEILRPHTPPYAGVSVSSVTNGVQLDFYSPRDNYPFVPGLTNSLATAQFIPRDAFVYGTDLNLNVWWQEIRPRLKNNQQQWEQVLSYLEQTNLLTLFRPLLGFDARTLLQLGLHDNMEVDVFNWTEGEFSWARLPDQNGQGQLLVFQITNADGMKNKLPQIIEALNAVGITGIQTRQMDNFLVVGYPEDVLDAALARPSLLSNARYQQMLSSYLLPSQRGVVYIDADRIQPYVPQAYSRFSVPLIDGAACYYVSSANYRLVLRVPTVPPPAMGWGPGVGLPGLITAIGYLDLRPYLDWEGGEFIVAEPLLSPVKLIPLRPNWLLIGGITAAVTGIVVLAIWVRRRRATLFSGRRQ